MSAPAENARSPAPVTTITLTASSAASASKQRVSSRRMVSFIALCTSGRFSVIVATASATSYRIASYVVVVTRDSFGSRGSAHDLARAQIGERRVRVAGRAQHLVRVLAERGRRPDVARRRRREEQRRARQGQAADVGMVVF